MNDSKLCFMNHFGKIFTVSILGESHGDCVGIVIDGVAAGINLCVNDFLTDIERRKGGIQKATTPRKEDDTPIIKSGVFNNKTTGSPLTILFENNNIKSNDYKKQKDIPRPGHADFVANKKFGGFEDYRGSGHFSGRLTLCIVAAGVVAKKMLQNIVINANLIEVGGETEINKGIDKAILNNDSVGGIVECVATGLPIGLGEPFFDSVESLIGHIIFSIPAVKGIEFGSGFAATKMLGSQHNDAIINENGTTKTNNAGGIVGGLTNGNHLLFRVAIKPTSSTPKIQNSYNTNTHIVEKFAVKGRHDLCIALRVPVVIEAATAIVLADLMLLEQRIKRVV
jgi:chorismate synthase